MAFSIFTVLYNHHIYPVPTHFQHHKSPHSLSSRSLFPNSKQPWLPPICFYEFTYPGYFIQVKHTIYEFLHLTSFTQLFFFPKVYPHSRFQHYIGAFLQCLAAAAKSLQSRPTLCDPIDSSPPGSPTPGILQARTLEWAISFSNA